MTLNAMSLGRGRVRWFICAALAVAMFAALCVPARAQAVPDATHKAPGAVVIKLTQWRVVADGKGGETFEDAAKIKPGEVIEYRATYSNVSKQPVRKLTVVLPLPQGLEYLPKSSRPSEPLAQAATDDGRYRAEPLMRSIVGKGGLPRLEPVHYNEYRSLRWSVPELGAGRSFEVKARVRVEDAPMLPVLSGSAGASAPMPGQQK